LIHGRKPHVVNGCTYDETDQCGACCHQYLGISVFHNNFICNLKPDKIVFYSMGVAKLFNIGFAIRTPENAVIIYWCGTPCNMPSKVLGISLGYSLPADAYSFEVLSNSLSQNAIRTYYIICR